MRSAITDCYASSYLKAVRQPARLRRRRSRRRSIPRSAPSDDYWAWIDALQARGMGHVLDVVPNHMGIARSANPWWMDVLENGAELAITRASSTSSGIPSRTSWRTRC